MTHTHTHTHLEALPGISVGRFIIDQASFLHTCITAGMFGNLGTGPGLCFHVRVRVGVGGSVCHTGKSGSLPGM